jgi:RNA polymerase sigma-70 factor (subfamily 1)
LSNGESSFHEENAMPLEPTPTQVLLRRVHVGDPAALNELYHREGLRVLAAVRARLGAELRQKVESWDIVQDAMLASLKNVSDFEQTSEGAFMKWLNQIVENRIRDHIDYFHAGKRDLRQENSLPARSPESSLPLDIPEKSGVPSPSQMLMLNEDLARLEKALDQLPTEARDLIVAVKLEEQSYQEIGDALGKSADAVRMQVNRAMAALTRAFQELETGGSST